jgi:hypothetical protein
MFEASRCFRTALFQFDGLQAVAADPSFCCNLSIHPNILGRMEKEQRKFARIDAVSRSICGLTRDSGLTI